MGPKAVLGLLIVVIATTVISAPASSQDLAAMHAWRREGGRTCMADHWHYGSSGLQPSRAAAQREAIRSWQDFTNLEYGSAWARFGRAASRRMGCSKSGGGWSCDAEARPCR